MTSYNGCSRQEKGFDYVGIDASTPVMEGLIDDIEALEMDSRRRYIKL
jgi:hypothetical protein